MRTPLRCVWSQRPEADRAFDPPTRGSLLRVGVAAGASREAVRAVRARQSRGKAWIDRSTHEGAPGPGPIGEGRSTSTLRTLPTVASVHAPAGSPEAGGVPGRARGAGAPAASHSEVVPHGQRLIASCPGSPGLSVESQAEEESGRARRRRGRIVRSARASGWGSLDQASAGTVPRRGSRVPIARSGVESRAEPGNRRLLNARAVAR